MKLFIVSGSQNKDSQSGRIARHISKLVTDQKIFDSSYCLELGETPLPLWTDDFPNNESEKVLWETITNHLSAADAIVIVSPEWGGIVPPALKNFLLMTSFGKKPMAYKPALLVGVSSTRGGAYPVAELRMSGYKNAFINWLPDHIIMRDCEKFFTGSAEPDIQYVEKRTTYVLKVLKEYGKALKQVRDSGVVDLKTYSNGM